MPKIPKFKNEKEEALFWDTHDSTEYLDSFQEVKDLQFPPPKHKSIVIDLESQDVETLKKLARKKHLPYHTLIQKWLKQKISKEAKTVFT